MHAASRRRRRYTYVGCALLGIAILTISLLAYLWSVRGKIIVAYAAPNSPISYEPITATLTRMELVTEDGSTVALMRRNRELLFSNGEMQEPILLSRARVPDGAYHGVRIWFADPQSEAGEGVFESLELPAKYMEFAAPVTVSGKETSAIMLAFQPQYSVYESSGKKLFVPVISIETRRNVTMPDKEIAVFSGGIIETNATFGTDEIGRTKINFRLVR